MATVGTPGAIQAVPTTAGSLGQGVAWPLSITTQGRLALAWGIALVEQQLRVLWETAPKERVMLPKFGAATSEFEPSDLQRQVARYKQQVSEYIPAVDYVEVDPVDGPGVGEVTVTVTYALKGEDSDRTLTFPYFVSG